MKHTNLEAVRHTPVLRPAALALSVAAVFMAAPNAFAQEAAALDSIVVTATKGQAIDLQEVPMGIEAFGTDKIDELHIQGLDDYVKYLPSVNTVRSQGQGGNGQPGSTHVYIRGVVSGNDGNHSGSLPSVGTYLDEQPVTTIDGALDIHAYDIQRIEVLEGPQGTLYGASSESGAIRIITNKPDAHKFAAGYDVGVNQVQNGGIGHTVEAFLNIPLASNAAIRLVGWDEHDGGYISNVAGTNAAAGIVNGVRTYPSWEAYSAANGGAGIGAGQQSNAAYVKNNYNTVDTKGGRAALKLDINDQWTVSPTFMAQSMASNGFFGYDPSIGDLQVTHFSPESGSDSFAQTALTVEGHVHNFDITYAGAWMKRDSHSVADYSDYAYFYDAGSSSYGSNFTNNAGQVINPQQIIYGDNYYTKLSHELRVTTPTMHLPVGTAKVTAGLFWQRQLHDIYQRYMVPNGGGLNTASSIPGFPGMVWMTDEERVDEDKAAFIQGTWNINPEWALTGGFRQFEYANSLYGFYGMNANFPLQFGVGTANCGPAGSTTSDPTFAPFHGAPCTNLNGQAVGSGHTPLLTLTHFINDDKMVYATYSEGFRPGGVNRAKDPTSGQFLPPYQAEYLKNFEFGWKTKWLNDRLRWNGAAFVENWNDFQFSFLVPPNSLTAVANVGSARILGLESNVEWSVTRGLTLSTDFSLLDGKTRSDYCGGPCSTNGVQAPSGTRLPVTPVFKGNVVARYNFKLNDEWKSHVQGTYAYQGSSTPALVVSTANALGTQPGFGQLDLSAGAGHNNSSYEFFLSNLFNTRGELTRFGQCAPSVCTQTYIVPIQPRTFGLKFSQKF